MIAGLCQQSAFHMFHQISTVGRFVALEAWRTRLPWITLVAFGLIVGASMFVKELTITESGRVEMAFLAVLTRLAAVFIASLYTISSMAREFNDRVVDLTLALELPRTSYVLGKFAGYATVTLAVGSLAGLLLSPFAFSTGLIVWTFSLVLELWIVVALSLFCIITFNQVMPAASFVLTFYLLARSVGTIQLISESPTLASSGLVHRFTGMVLDALGYLLPSLDRFSQTDWILSGGGGPEELGIVLGQSAVYLALLVSATLFDFHRRNF
jgi:ABC-type transport system involved in multi-copper enzyme maturation permease subunit